MNALVIALLLCDIAVKPQWRVVVSLQKFHGKGLHITLDGQPQLWEFNLGGSAVKQLTRGKRGAVLPSEAKRGVGLDYLQGRFDGPGLKQQGMKLMHLSAKGVAPRFIRDLKSPGESVDWNTADPWPTRPFPARKWLLQRDLRWSRMIGTFKTGNDFDGVLHLNPEGTRVVVSGNWEDPKTGRCRIVDLRNGKAAVVKDRIMDGLWLNQTEFLGLESAGPENTEHLGEAIAAHLCREDGTSRKSILLVGPDWIGIYSKDELRHLWPTQDPKVVLLESRHWARLGSVDAVFEFHLDTGAVKQIVDGTALAESPDLRWLLTEEEAGKLSDELMFGVPVSYRLTLRDLVMGKKVDLNCGIVSPRGGCFIH